MSTPHVLRMGRISYLNVLPVYHPLEAGILPHDFELVSGPPALLNEMMSRGELHVSSCSCFEYARRPERYYLVGDLSIGSRGPVMSVLLLSRLPVEELGGHEILISGESHTSVALLRLLMRDRYKLDVRFSTGPVTPALRSDNPPTAFLAIGDEALRLRNHPDYPYRLDLAEAWRDWTGLPFIFGLWVVSREAAEQGLFSSDPGALLRRGPVPHGCDSGSHRPGLPVVARGTAHLLPRRPGLQPGRRGIAGPATLLQKTRIRGHDPRRAAPPFFQHVTLRPP